MWEYNYSIPNDELYHYGVKGMKWGVRRYQNPDGTLTSAGLKRYSKRSYVLKTTRNVTVGTAVTAALGAIGGIPVTATVAAGAVVGSYRVKKALNNKKLLKQDAAIRMNPYYDNRLSNNSNKVKNVNKTVNNTDKSTESVDSNANAASSFNKSKTFNKTANTNKTKKVKSAKNSKKK